MIDRQHGKLIFECDSCPEIFVCAHGARPMHPD